MPLQEALLVHPHAAEILERAALKAPCHSSLHDPVGGRPTDPQQLASLRGAPGVLKQVDGVFIEGKAEARHRIRRGYPYGLWTVFRAVRPGNAGAQDRLQLHRVEMPPLARHATVVDRAGLPALGASNLGSTPKRQGHGSHSARSFGRVPGTSR